MDKIITMYITLIPPILAGILNMAWCKSNVLKCIAKPIDGGIILKDNQRMFGDSKTWKGLIGYIFLNTVTFIIWGSICKNNNFLQNHNYFYLNHENTIILNATIGFLLGVAYSVFELPNSFLKRRLGIGQSKEIASIQRTFFIFLDQADSILGCVLVVWLFYNIGIITYIEYVLLGAITHIAVNVLLYLMKLRKNMF